MNNNLNDNELQNLIDTFQSPIKNIINNEHGNLITFESGEEVQLYGKQMEIKSLESDPICNFCEIITNKPLFTINDRSYICHKCATLAIETFAKNGINIEFKIQQEIPQIENIFEKSNDDG